SWFQCFDEAKETGQRLEGAFVPLLFGEEAQHRLSAEQADTKPVLLLAHSMVRANELDAGDGLQLARSLMEHQVDVRERLEACAEPRFRLADPFCHRADSSTLERIEVEDAVGLAQAERAEHDRLGLVRAAGHDSASLVPRVEGTFAPGSSLHRGDGEDPRLLDPLVRILRPREGATRRQRARVRRGVSRRRPYVSPEALRSHRRLDGSPDRDRRQADRRVRRALATRARRTARRRGRGLSRVESLAGGAVPRAATGGPDLVDRRSATRTRFSFAAVDAKAILHTATSSVRGRVVAETRALACDPRLERSLHGTDQSCDLVVVQRARESPRMDLRVPQRLVDVDVAEARHGALVEQGGLDRRAAP